MRQRACGDAWVPDAPASAAPQLIRASLDRQAPIQNKAKFWADESLGGLELLYANYLTQEFAPHTHDFYAIGVVQSGALSFKPKSPSEVVPPGNIMIIHPGEVHTGRCVGDHGCKYRMFYVHPTNLRELFQHLSGKPVESLFFRDQNIEDKETAKLLHSLHVAIESLQAPAIEKESRLILALTNLLVRHATPRPFEIQDRPNRKFVKMAKEFIEDHYHDNVTLKEIALAVNISPFHLLSGMTARTTMQSAPVAQLNSTVQPVGNLPSWPPTKEQA